MTSPTSASSPEIRLSACSVVHSPEAVAVSCISVLQKQPQAGGRKRGDGKAGRIQIAVLRGRTVAENPPFAGHDFSDRTLQFRAGRGSQVATARGSSNPA